MQGLEKKPYPSDNQIREFWEWCGFKEVEYLNTSGKHCASHFVSPDGTWGKGWFPDVDLNNLFKFALPRAREAVGATELSKRLQGWINDFVEVGIEPVYSLFYLLDNIRQSGRQ